jgi:nucleoside-diphosphate-sugar epimerase
MRCLITGIGGVVGSNVGSILKQHYGWEIIGLGSSVSGKESYVRADLSQTNDIERASEIIGLADIVIHCAALLDNKRDPTDLFSTNVIGSINALKLAKNLKSCHFINISSVPIIGNIVDTPITESHICRPTTGYHLSKLHAEQVIDFYTSSTMSVLSLRIPSPVGLGMPLRSIFPIVLNQALTNQDIKLIGDRRRRQNYLDLRDLTQAIYKISSLENLRGVYNIAAKDSVSNLELAEAIVRKVKSKSVIVDEMESSSVYIEDWTVDFQKAKSRFGYSPEYGISDSVDWILQGTT